MAIEINMPALSPTMEKGTLAKWNVKVGDKVESGDVLCEIETDKATMEVESIDDGVVAKILVEDGTDDVAVGTLIALLAEEGEDIADVSVVKKPETAAAPKVEASSAPQAAVAPAAPAPVAVAATPSVGNSRERIKASPLARRIAEQAGLDLKAVTASGPNGRIIKADVEAAIAAGKVAAPQPVVKTAPVVSEVASYPVPADIPFEEVRLSNMRKTIARRLTESKQSVPHFYLTVDCEIDKLLALRKELNSKGEDQGIKLSVNDFIIKAVGMALKKVPDANAMFAGDKMYKFGRADISVAVAIDGGLITPVVRGACSKGLAEISANVKDLAGRAKEGKLIPEEYTGGTFSISNLGMFGIKEFSAVINPPEGAILAIGAGEKRPVVKDGALAVGTVMSCTMSCDHRVIDGSVGAEFLSALKGYIQDPLTMML